MVKGLLVRCDMLELLKKAEMAVINIDSPVLDGSISGSLYEASGQ